jgi:hypothetical protein
MPPVGKNDLIEERAGKESIEHSRRGGGELVPDSGRPGIKDQIRIMGLPLGLFYSNCLVLTDFNAALTAQTLFGVYWVGLFVFEFKNLDGADFYTFPTAGALVMIHRWREHKMGLLSLFFSICYKLIKTLSDNDELCPITLIL